MVCVLCGLGPGCTTEIVAHRTVLCVLRVLGISVEPGLGIWFVGCMAFRPA